MSVYYPENTFSADIILPNIDATSKLNMKYLFIISFILNFFISLSCRNDINIRNGIVFVYLHDNFKNAVFNGSITYNGIDAAQARTATTIRMAPTTLYF
jgi:hypothetical protein